MQPSELILNKLAETSKCGGWKTYRHTTDSTKSVQWGFDQSCQMHVTDYQESAHVPKPVEDNCCPHVIVKATFSPSQEDDVRHLISQAVRIFQNAGRVVEFFSEDATHHNPNASVSIECLNYGCTQVEFFREPTFRQHSMVHTFMWNGSLSEYTFMWRRDLDDVVATTENCLLPILQALFDR